MAGTHVCVCADLDHSKIAHIVHYGHVYTYTNNIQVEYRARCHIMQHRSAKGIEQLGLDECRDSMGHAQTIHTVCYVGLHKGIQT